MTRKVLWPDDTPADDGSVVDDNRSHWFGSPYQVLLDHCESAGKRRGDDMKALEGSVKTLSTQMVTLGDFDAFRKELLEKLEEGRKKEAQRYMEESIAQGRTISSARALAEITERPFWRDLREQLGAADRSSLRILAVGLAHAGDFPDWSFPFSGQSSGVYRAVFYRTGVHRAFVPC